MNTNQVPTTTPNVVPMGRSLRETLTILFDNVYTTTSTPLMYSRGTCCTANSVENLDRNNCNGNNNDSRKRTLSTIIPLLNRGSLPKNSCVIEKITTPSNRIQKDNDFVDSFSTSSSTSIIQNTRSSTQNNSAEAHNDIPAQNDAITKMSASEFVDNTISTTLKVTDNINRDMENKSTSKKRSLEYYSQTLEQLQSENKQIQDKRQRILSRYTNLIFAYEYGLNKISKLNDLRSVPDNVMKGNEHLGDDW